MTFYKMCEFVTTRRFLLCAAGHGVSADAPEDWKGRGTWRLLDVNQLDPRSFLASNQRHDCTL